MQSLFLIEMRFYVGKCNIKEWRLYWSLSLLLECFLRDDDDELFLSYGWPRKDIYRSFHLALLSEILTIANLRHATSRVWTCAEPEFRLGWMKLRISDKQRRHNVILILFTDVILIYLQSPKHDYFSSVSSLLVKVTASAYTDWQLTVATWLTVARA